MGKNIGKPRGRGRIGLTGVLALMIAVAVTVLSVVFLLYFNRFGPAPLSGKPEVWGQFGDYVGGVVNPIVGFLSLLALIFTIRSQQEANHMAHQQFIDERRPWITVAATLSSPLIWEEKGLRFSAQLRFRNIGKIPATHFFVEAVASVEGPAGAGVQGTLLNHMSDVKARRELPNTSGPVLFPGEERMVNFGLLVHQGDIDQNLLPIPVPRHGESTLLSTFSPFFVGNVSYRYAGSDEVHQTGFSYMLVRVSKEGKYLVLCRGDRNVPGEFAGFVDSYEGIAT
ncbi:MAG: hypothetical protein V4812_14155 [Pseudomonadota bacterium]